MDTFNVAEDTNSENPLCADWQVWVGQEVEGETDLKEWTLFIRKNLTQRELDVYINAYREFLKTKGQKNTRIWFTKDFGSWQVLRYAKQVVNHVCLEVDILELFGKGIRRLPYTLLYNVQLYVKIACSNLKKGDHVCIGKAFEDESFMLGNGRKVTPEDYRSDFQLI